MVDGIRRLLLGPKTRQKPKPKEGLDNQTSNKSRTPWNSVPGVVSNRRLTPSIALGFF